MLREVGAGLLVLPLAVFRLPAEVRAEAAAASYRRGVLRIELPKAKPDAPRHVSVTVQ